MTSYKKVIFITWLAVFMSLGVVVPRPASAQFADVIGGPTTIVKFVWEKVEKVYDAVKSIVGSELSNRTVGMFLDSLAYDVATELAQGGPGGKPQFRTVSIKKALQNSQDKALGEFLGELTTKGFDELGINLCNPSLELKLTLTLGLIDEEKPPKPKCDWDRLEKNWQQFDDNLQANIIKFQLDPRQNGATSTVDFFKGLVSKESSDLRQAFALEAELNRRKLEAEKTLELSIEECQGFADKKTPITEEVITHCSVNHGMAADLFTNATQIEAEKQLAKKQAADNKKLSDILKDAGNKFLNTFTSKLMKNWIKKGMWSLFGSTENDIYQNYRDTLIDRLRGGADIRQPRGSDIFKDLVTINVETIDDFDYLNDFTICPNEFRSPDNCVMSPAFLQAVNNKLTVKQAVEQGIIEGTISFVHPEDHQNHTVDKCYRDGLCYANLVKLRKANIIPVGWEMAALRGPVSLKQAMDCFEEKPADDPTKCEFDVSPEFAVGGNDHNPFYHLVDPNWVLKAPEVRCDAYSFSSILESPDSSNRQKYCADPKVCLREDAEGNCIDEQYNYCTRTENSWNFEGQACAGGEIYAGCLTFANKEFGNDSYIQDTLEYCTSNQAGCRRYSQDKNGAGDWVLEDIAVDDNDLFLNNQSAQCSDENAGCSEYIVMSVDTETNLVPNGGFNDFDGNGYPDSWVLGNSNLPADGIDDPNGANNAGGISLDYDGDKLPNGYSFGGGGYPTTEIVNTKVFLRPNTIYIVSAEAAQYEDGRSDRARIVTTLCDNENGCNQAATLARPIDGAGGTCLLNVGAHPNNADLWFIPTDTEMERGSCSFITNEFTDYAVLSVLTTNLDPGALWFDNLKIEAVSSVTAQASTYSVYGQGSKIYMDDSTVMCSADEVGCQGYLPVNGDPMIPAVIVQEDLCPAECIGYDTFTEQPNTFDIIEGNNFVEYYNFIADTARQCPDQEVGCEEFTNLDVVAEGGEGREYFTYLRQCVSPADGATYYTWEGSEVAGYQIKTWNALPSNLGGGDAPCTNMAPAGNVCLDAPANIANCGPDTPDPNDDPANDPNCREFFDIDGTVSYRLQDRVIFATDNCHDYRRTLTDQVYKAVPDESITCAETNNGCSSYYGNNSNNIRLVVSDNFEQGTYAPWNPVGAGSLDLSTEALNNNGHSLRSQTGRLFARDMVNVRLQNNKEYTISWWMKSEAVIDTFSLRLSGNDANGDSFVETFADSDVDSNFQNIEAGRWHYYTASAYVDDLDLIDINFINQLEFQIETGSPLPDQGLYIDNFIVKEVQNSFSVIRNSWTTPLSCDSPYEGYHLGCQSYNDLNGQAFNLKSFDRLCREEAIGCMPAISTNNSTNSVREVFHSGDYSEIVVEADEVVYLVPDPNNYCPQEAKGCTALGLPDRLDETKFSAVYKINDPDKYNDILCDAEGLNCSEYNTNKGISYLKDPGLNTCTYQQNVLIDGSLLSGWFKTVNLGDEIPLGCADTDGDPYASNGLYDVGELILPRDYCSVAENDPTQLFYFTEDDCQQNGGFWNNYLMAAQCPASEDSCTIFRDSVDPINCDPKGRNIDFIDYDGFCIDNITKNKIAVAQAACLANPNQTWVYPSHDGYCDSDIFNNERDCTRAGWHWTPYCQEYYYYDNSNIDETACNGQVDRQNGCVLFYDANNWNGEHSQVITLYDTEETYEDSEVSNSPVSPVICDPSFDPTCELTSNRLIKVIKDRQCAEWLACKSSVASFDKESEEYKIVCDDLSTCLEFQYDPDSNTTKCKKWGSYDEEVEALTFEKYQSRDTGPRNHIAWSDKEYTGYSIPNSLPVGELTVYDFGQANNQMTRLAYDIVNRSDAQGSYYSTCVDGAGNSLDGQACTATINTEGGYYFRGECQDRVCWVGPLANSNATSTYALESRAYSVADAPFPSAIEPRGIERLSKYKGANICTNDATSPNACELSFKKVTFGSGQETHYYPEDAPSGTIPAGICTSGVTFEDVGGQKVPKECPSGKNSECDSLDDNGNKRGDGTCALRTEEIIFRNWPGICLEYDLSSPVTKDGSNSYYCNQWYPAQKVRGTASLYDNYREAGYYDPAGRDALFCAVAEPYVTTEDRFYCGYFNGGNECNVLLRVPAGSQVNLNMANQYSELLDEGSWINLTPNLITPSTDTIVEKDIIVTIDYTRFDRFEYFNNVLPRVSDFMDIINNMFDSPDGIRRFYWDDNVGANGADNGNAFVRIPKTYHRSGGECQNCPNFPVPSGYHFVKSTCKMGGHCGSHRWRNGNLWANPLIYNYYVDVNSTDEEVEVYEPQFVGSCVGDCKFVARNIADSNHGRGCLQDSVKAPTYSTILINYASSTLPGDFDLNLCRANINVNDCNFVSCIQNLSITDQTASHSCGIYDSCFSNILADDGTLIASEGLYLETLNCFSAEGFYDDDNNPTTDLQPIPGWDDSGPDEMLDFSEYNNCLAENEEKFTNWFRGVDEDALIAFCSQCVLEERRETYDLVSAGVNCDESDAINCYQQCRIVTHLDSEGLLSAVRTDIWWREGERDNNHQRIRQAFPWVSWYADPARGYVTSTESPSASDDEVLYDKIALFPNTVGDYPNNFSPYGAGLDTFEPDKLVSTRVPYYRVSPDNLNLTVGTFFSYFDDDVDTLAQAVNRAQLQMQDIFFRVYNLNWSSASSTYQYYAETDLAGGNHSNPYAGPDYSPRILATCGDSLCETVDSNGNVVDVEQGITVNGVTGGNLIGLEGSLFTNTRFFYHAHPDHMPVYSVDADWGDGVVNNFSLNPGKYKNSLPLTYCDPEISAPGDANPITPGREPQLMGFAGEDRACQSGYKVFYHDYLYDDTRNHDCNGAASGAPGTPAKPVIPNASCYQPRIRVMDNWGWFRVVPFDGWIVVYDE